MGHIGGGHLHKADRFCEQDERPQDSYRAADPNSVERAALGLLRSRREARAALWYEFYRSASRTGDQPVLTLEGLGGARYVYFRAKIEATITGPLGGTVQRTVQGKQDWTDPFVGGRLFWNLCDNLIFGFRGDVGGFGLTSDFTGNLDTSFRYKFADCLNLFIGYRGLFLNHRDGSFKFDGWIYGPWVGVGVGF